MSIAEVAQPGAFSSFPGIDRTLTLLVGAELLLEFSGGGTVRLTPGDAPLAFPGEAGVTGHIPGGTVLDFNVMSRRGRVAHHVLPAGAGAPPPLNCAALLCRAGHTTYMGLALAPGDLLLLEAAERLAPLPFGSDLLSIQLFFSHDE
jgi:uncharacterized protein